MQIKTEIIEDKKITSKNIVTIILLDNIIKSITSPGTLHNILQVTMQANVKQNMSEAFKVKEFYLFIYLSLNKYIFYERIICK